MSGDKFNQWVAAIKGGKKMRGSTAISMYSFLHPSEAT